MKTIERFGAMFCVIVTLFVASCSSDGDDQPQATGGGSGASGTAGFSGQSGSSGQGGVGGQSGQSGSSGQGGATGDASTDAVMGGSSGVGGSGGSQDAGSEDSGPKPFNCTVWTRDDAFPANRDLTGDILGSSGSDVYVATGKFDTGEIAHFDGASWSLMALPDITPSSWFGMNAVWGSSANDVWAGGSLLPQTGAGNSALLHREDGGAWQLDPNFPTVELDDVKSVWGANMNDVFVLVSSYATGQADAKIFRKSGGSWLAMTLPPHTPHTVMRQLWGKSVSKVYAVGTWIDAGSSSEEALLWRFDGNAWQNITTLPADVVQLGGVHGVGNETWVVGSYSDGSNYHGVRLMTTDLSNWSRFDSTETEYDSEFWLPWPGAALVGGRKKFQTGSAMMGALSLGLWTEYLVDGMSSDVTGIWSVPGSNRVLAATYSDMSGYAGVISATCQ